MHYKKKFFLGFVLIFAIISNAEAQGPFRFKEYLSSYPQKETAFCISKSNKHIELLSRDHILIKYETDNFLFINATPIWIETNIKSGDLNDFYFEYAPPAILSDTTLLLYHVNPVHNGSSGLNQSYTGKDVIIGIVDQGLDWNHPDFKDSIGKTRVLRYWDHSINSGGIIPQPYNYGIVWTKDQIDNGSCTSIENSTAHGTTVTGMAASNGFANGTHLGMAPEANLIIVETDFNLANWTLTIADACDYIFKVADSLNMPAVINLSLGTYLGSHDGSDPASEYIESLLDESPGRIVVSATGNAGAKGKFHVHNEVDNDTSFVWFINNPSSSAALGPNHIFFDLWTDQIDANFNFCYGANLSNGNYSERGVTNFHNALSSLNASPTLDTLFNDIGHRIATIETYTEIVNGIFHLESYFSNIDSTSYIFSFKTFGSGSYDLWSGAWMGLNDIVQNIPNSSTYPDIVNYILPDSLQTIVSSWNCSEKVISVGNVRNRIGHVDKNGNYYTPANDNTPVGKRSPNSSRGPNRNNVIKPDVSASGDVSLAAAPLWLLNNPANNSLIDSGGWHARNGGTSMASPVIAGIAALYLEKCSKATYADFKSDLISTSFTDGFTGVVANNNYGYGKPHALNLMLQNEFNASIFGDDTLCTNDGQLSLLGSENLSTGIWSNGNEGLSTVINSPGLYSATAYNMNGCKYQTDTFEVVLLDPLPMLPITQSGNTLATISLTNYQWTINGIDIVGANGPTLIIEPPYGVYTCYCTNEAGCISSTAPYQPFLTVNLNLINGITIHPNPSSGLVNISGDKNLEEIKIFNSDGKLIQCHFPNATNYQISNLKSGIYFIEILMDSEKINSKFIQL
jgi:subtilisin family serine protease